MTIRFALLGPLRVEAAGRPVRIRAAKQRALLAALLSSANRVVPAEELIDRLWGGAEPSDARGALQIHLSRLRTALGDTAPIRTEQDGYLIAVAADELDILEFRDLMSRARAAGDLASEAELVRGALSLWTGRPLADIASDSLQRDIVPQLEEEWFQALHRRFDVERESPGHRRRPAQPRHAVPDPRTVQCPADARPLPLRPAGGGPGGLPEGGGDAPRGTRAGRRCRAQ